MKKVALVFVLAVLAPSLVLAWLAVRSLRDQQFLLERQQSLLDQHVTDTLAQNISDYLARQQQDFSAQVESLAAAGDAKTLAAQFDDQLRKRWPVAEVGFCVTIAGKILSPLPNARPAAQMFRLDNSGFLGNREPVEVYLTANNLNANGPANAGLNSTLNFNRSQANPSSPARNSSSFDASVQPPQEQRRQSNIGDISTAANASSPVLTASIPPAQQKPQATATATESPAPAAVVTIPPQAFATYGNSAKNSGGGGQAGQFSNTRNGFYIPSANQVPPGRQQQLNDVGQSMSTDSSRSPETTPKASSAGSISQTQQQEKQEPVPAAGVNAPVQPSETAPQDTLVADNAVAKDTANQWQYPNGLNFKAAQERKVSPQSQTYQNVDKSKVESAADDVQNNLSKVVPAEAEFRQLIGSQNDGMLARFLQNKLKLMCWHRLNAQPDLIFGAQLNLDRVVDGLRGLVQPDRSWGDEICLAVLDDNAKPVVVSRPQFRANWKRPFVATEVGDALPHWEAAAYLVNPAQLTQAARTEKLTLGLLIAVLVIAIGIGSLLIVRSLDAELKLARQKTDFVGNVSHELKTPLTSIRMFSELLAEGRVGDPAKQRSYLQIISAEAARLTRLINNVLDFSRMERGEKKYNFQPCDLTDIVRTAAETLRPHLESSGFKFACELPAANIPVRGDADALSQIIVNLLSNAEKYSNGGKEVSLQLAQKQSPLPHAEINVLDRGPGVPRGSEEKVFEKFYRGHDSLSSGIQGSGLGLTIARQIARAHGGDVVYEPREGGGSCFSLRLPVQTS